MNDVVIGIDASTTAVKAIAFTRDGSELFQARAAYPLSTPLPGHYEQDPEDWWAALLKALREIASTIDASRIVALSIAHQRESFTLIDDTGKALVPAILWLDERARPQVRRLSAEIGREKIRDWSGKPPDPTPALYGVAWLAEHRPQALRQARAIVDTGGFLVHRLTGRLVTSTASADPLGFLSLETQKWHRDLFEAVGLAAGQLPDLLPPGAICGGLSADAARLTGLTAGIPVVAGAGDGQAMGLGMGVVNEGKAYLSLGSGVVSGINSNSRHTSDAFRTLVAPAGGFMLETVLRSGMQLVDWVVRTAGTQSVATLENAAKDIAAGSDGLLVMPYWAGVMNPYWDDAARGAIVGLSLNHTPAHLFRAALEGIAFEQAIATEAMETGLGHAAASMTVAGGGTNSRLLLQILATVLERQLSVSTVNEAAALGAAMLAATAAGWFPSPAQASLAMARPSAACIEPVESLKADYARRKTIYKDLYFATRDIHTRLDALR